MGRSRLAAGPWRHLVTIDPMPRRQIPNLLVALLGLLIFFSAVISGGEGTPSKHASSSRVPIGAPSYGFGGYQLYPRKLVSTMSGEWTVPTIAPSSSAGDASTWIGAQADNGAFAQIGTVENRLDVDQYFAFWSDVPKGFRPEFVITVKPGDRVKATMTMGRTGWELTLDDLTSATSRTIDSKYGVKDRFNSCEWFQENPVYSQFIHTSYPTLSSVTIDHLALNGTEPKLDFQDAQTLSTQNDTFFVPTHVHDDGFTLRLAKGNALAFLSDVYIEDELGAAFFESATQGIEPGNITTNTFIAGLGFELPLLRSQQWPMPVAKAVGRYVANQKHLETYMQQWLQQPPAERLSDLSSVANQLLQSDLVADHVRERLNLPPFYG
jgi:Peptidase A4 family